MAARGSRLIAVIGGFLGAACASTEPREATVLTSPAAEQPREPALTCDDRAIAPQGCVGIESVRRLPPLNGAMKDREAERPLDPEPHYRLATVFEERGLLENALDEYRDAAELSHGRNARAVFAAARLSEQLGRRIDAVPLCQRFLARKTSRELPDEHAWCMDLLADAQDH